MSRETPDLSLHVKERQARRISRKKLMIVIQVLACGLIIIIGLSFWPGNSSYIRNEETHVIRKNQKPEGLEKLPQSYDYLGSSTEKNKRKVRYAQTGASATKAAKEARASGLFFRVSQQTARNASISNRNRGETLSNDLTSLSSTLDHRLQGLNHQTWDPVKDPNFLRHKQQFLKSKTDRETLSKHKVHTPPSPTMLMAGTIISASLLTGLNSDLPGQVMAQVSEPVYDTITGHHMLIPQGARLLGRYDSVIAHGQKRAFVVWHRLVLPNGTSVVIDNLPATDPSGYTGLKDRVDYHTWSLIKGVALATVVNVGTGLAFRSEENELIKAIRESTQGTIERAGDKIINQKLNQQPTLKVRPGWPLRIVVRKDIVMTPYVDTP